MNSKEELKKNITEIENLSKNLTELSNEEIEKIIGGFSSKGVEILKQQIEMLKEQFKNEKNPLQKQLLSLMITKLEAEVAGK